MEAERLAQEAEERERQARDEEERVRLHAERLAAEKAAAEAAEREAVEKAMSWITFFVLASYAHACCSPRPCRRSVPSAERLVVASGAFHPVHLKALVFLW